MLSECFGLDDLIDLRSWGHYSQVNWILSSVLLYQLHPDFLSDDPSTKMFQVTFLMGVSDLPSWVPQQMTCKDFPHTCVLTMIYGVSLHYSLHYSLLGHLWWTLIIFCPGPWVPNSDIMHHHFPVSVKHLFISVNIQTELLFMTFSLADALSDIDVSVAFSLRSLAL